MLQCSQSLLPESVEKMAFFDILIINRTIRVEIIIVLFQQVILCRYSDVSKNVAFSIFIADKTFQVKTNNEFCDYKYYQWLKD